jgi:voltage-gated potassium channel
MLGRRGLGTVGLLTLIVTLAGAAGMSYFEGARLNGYGDALWWTGMIMTTLGSDYWPQTGEGRVLAWLLSAYALGVFGYLTGAIASYLVGIPEANRDASREADLRAEIAGLRREVARLAARLPAEDEE